MEEDKQPERFSAEWLAQNNDTIVDLQDKVAFYQGLITVMMTQNGVTDFTLSPRIAEQIKQNPRMLVIDSRKGQLSVDVRTPKEAMELSEKLKSA
jgi:hypothetical protein